MAVSPTCGGGVSPMGNFQANRLVMKLIPPGQGDMVKFVPARLVTSLKRAVCGVLYTLCQLITLVRTHDEY